MAAGGLGGWFQSATQRYVADLTGRARQIGWDVGPGDGASAVFTGRAGDGSDFRIAANLFDDDDGTSDYLVWSSGPPRLDSLLLAITNDPSSGRGWCRNVEVPGGLAHDDPDREAVRKALDEKAAEGVSVAELNAYALRLGAGGSSGVVLRFEESAVEIETEIAAGGRRIQVLALDRGVAAHVLADTVRSKLLPVLAAARPSVGPSFQAFAGVPFSKLFVETRWTTVELLQDIVELGAALRARALSAPAG
ncbi:MAG TPA: hypothetical protein VJK66_01795 [Gaiellaceae bacterium]|nr:hypothetical protein [Gaiellaceae bacterium]